MGSRHTEEFALDDAGSPGDESSAGHDSSGHGPTGPGRRRRSAPGWRHRPSVWVALAVVLVVAGAAVSPQGDPVERRPPDTAWTAAADPGRAPGLWVLADQPVIAAADGVSAFDPTTGDPAWTVPLDDPACTATTAALTCVHGEGENASIATIDPTGEATEQPFPGADIAADTGEDLVVGGSGPDGELWLGRYTVTGSAPPAEVWRYQPEVPGEPGVRLSGATVSQGVATAFAEPDAQSDDESRPGPAIRFAADLETGEPRPAVVRTATGTGVSYTAGPAEAWDEVVLPLAGPEPTVPGHPDAVFTSRGAFDSYGGDRILEYLGEPLLAVDGTVIVSELETDVFASLEAGEEIELATRTERIDVRTGEAQWQLDRDQLLGCPCASSGDSIVLTGSVIQDRERLILGPVALLGIDPDTGRHHWTVPISTAPDGIAGSGDHVYVLTGGTLTAYADR